MGKQGQITRDLLRGNLIEQLEDIEDRLRRVEASGAEYSTVAAAVTVSASFDHGNLAGLADDDHSSIYVHLANARTISAVHTFNPDAAGSPFSIGANGSGQTVTGLQADTLDQTVTAGDGLTGGGALTAGISLALTAPGTLSVASGNTAAGSHTHAITSSVAPGAAASILATNSSGLLTLVALEAVTRIDPTVGYTANLGSLSKKWLTLHAAELAVETIVAAETQATISGRILVGVTTTIAADVLAADSSITVVHNSLSIGDVVRAESGGNVEYMQITGAATGAGPYSHTVTRSLEVPLGANDWAAGTAIFNTGTTGDGFIDLYSSGGILTGTGPSIIGNVKTGTAYNAIATAWAIGNLQGNYGYAGTEYGAAFGHYVSGKNNITIDATNGIRFRSYTTEIGSLRGTGWTIGSTSTEHIAVTSTDLRIKNGASTTLMLLAGSSLTIGQTGSEHMILNGTDLRLKNSTSTMILLSGTTITLGSTSTEHMIISATDLRLKNSTTTYLLLSSTAVTVGNSAGDHVSITPTGIEILESTTSRGQWTSNYIKIGSNLAFAAGTHLSVFNVNTTYNGEGMTAGDMLIGNNTAGKANILWAYAYGELWFRGGTTVHAYINTTGEFVAGQGDVKLNTSGLFIKTGTATKNRISFDYAGLLNQAEIWQSTTALNIATIGVGEFSEASSILLDAQYSGNSANDASVTIASVGNSGSGNSSVTIAATSLIYNSRQVIQRPSTSDVTGYSFVHLYSGGHPTAWNPYSSPPSGTYSASVWGVPTSARALLFSVAITSGATGIWVRFRQSSSGITWAMPTIQATGVALQTQIIVPLDSSGNFYYQTGGTHTIWVGCVGYFT